MSEGGKPREGLQGRHTRTRLIFASFILVARRSVETKTETFSCLPIFFLSKNTQKFFFNKIWKYVVSNKIFLMKSIRNNRIRNYDGNARLSGHGGLFYISDLIFEQMQITRNIQ